MTVRLRRMRDLARFLFENGEPALLEDVLRMAMSAAPSEPRVVALFVRMLAGQGRHDEAIAVGDAWTARHGPVADLLGMLTQIRASRGDPGAVAAARRAAVAAPHRRDVYGQLVGLLDRLPDKRPALRVLQWWSVWFEPDDPQAAILLHKAFQVGRDSFEQCAGRLMRSRPDLLWAPYLKTLIAVCDAGRSVREEALRSEPEPAFRGASVACVAALAGHATPMFADRAGLFDHCLGRLDGRALGRLGHYLEFGVATGRSTRLIAARLDGTLHAFDSFQGLPEAWEGEAAGSYSTGGRIPDLPANVQTHVGWFDDTIPDFAARHPGPIAFVHVDCDLYASTAAVFSGLGPRFAEGSVVVFDEYFGYPGFERHEARAFEEFLERSGWRAEAIAVGPFTKQMAFQLRRG